MNVTHYVVTVTMGIDKRTFVRRRNNWSAYCGGWFPELNAMKRKMIDPHVNKVMIIPTISVAV